MAQQHKKNKTIQEIKTILKENIKPLTKEYHLKEIAIFGSYVRGEQKKGSDVDILVEFNEIPDLLKFIELERRLQRLLGQKVDLVRKKTIRPELKANILNEAIAI